MIEHYHAEKADGTEVRFDVMKRRSRWVVIETEFVDRQSVTHGHMTAKEHGTFNSEADAGVAASRLADELEKREGTAPW